MNTVSFPGLGIGEFTLHDEAFAIGNFSIKWYAICICIGLLVAFFVCQRKTAYFGLGDDDFLDLVLFAVPFGLIGARVGYILMDLDSFQSFSDMIAVWNGGLSIYGGLISALITLIVVCKIKKIDLFGVLDLAAIGIMIGQIIGRFGNFFNIEVYGVQTNLPWRMGIGTDGISEYVHPLFLYESLWNLIGLVLILAFLDQRKFKGETFLWYTAWYGLGRAFMEGLRNPDFQLTAGPVKINQLIAAIACAAAVITWVYFRFFKISVHFDVDEKNKALSLRELHELREQIQFEKQSEKYQTQFETERNGEEDAAVSEDEYTLKKMFDQLEEMDGEKTDGEDH